MALKFKKDKIEGTAQIGKEMKKGKDTLAETQTQEQVTLTPKEDESNPLPVDNPNLVTADKIAVPSKNKPGDVTALLNKQKPKNSPGKYGVTVQGDEVQKAEPALVPGPFCEVGFDASYTHNLGNYQSCRISVSLKVPCQIGEINGVYEMAKEWVDTRMQQLQADLGTDG